MKNRLRTALTLIGLIFGVFPALQATHIMGVDISTECLGNCTYRIHWRAYRDCNGVTQINPNLTFIPISGSNCAAPVAQSAWTNQNTVEVTPICPGIPTRCTDPTATINGVQEYYRYRDFNICSTNCIYRITWGDCCRNNAITSGAASDQIYTWTTTINTGIPCNSSPQFSNPPVPYICLGQSFTFNQGAYDPDGDSLAYSLGPCYDNDSTTQVGYNGGAGFTPTSPLGPSWNVNLNSQTGDISITPNPGNLEVGVLCIYVNEYRNGVLIGTVVRDMQITVIDCGNNTVPSTNGASNISGGNANGFNVATCLGSNLCFDIPVTDPDQGQTVTFWWDQSIPGATFTQTGGGTSDTITGANPSATFCWTPAAAGSYNFLVTMEDDNCPIIGRNQYTFTITVNPPLTANPTATPVCDQGDFSATVTGGSAPFTYTWSGTGGLTGTGANISYTYPGPGNYQYAVTITDAAGCSDITSGTVSIAGIPTATVTGTDVSCAGGNDGNAVAVAADGTAPYTYAWNSNPVQTTSTATNLVAGNYTVTVTDAAGCQGTASTTLSEPPALTLQTTFTDVTCAGAADGTAEAVPGGGTAPYSYSWNSNPVQTTAIATGLSGGTYSVTVTDGNGCTLNETVTIGEPQPLALTLQNSATLCDGSADGTATVQVSGGSGTYTYSWNTNPVQTTAAATGLAAGNYTVTVTDGNGCVETGNTSVASPAAITATVTTTDVSCNGGNDGTATVNASGGSQAYTYAWNTTPVQTTVTATNLTAGAWTVTITDGNGCTETAVAAIAEPAALAVQVTGTDVTCSGAANGTATAVVNGGSGTYSYSWSTNPIQTNSTATGLAGGNYTVQVTDGNGCVATNTVTLAEPQVLAISLTATDPTCNGGNNGSIAAQVTGGLGSYSYSWNTNPVQTTATATGIGAGNYTVTVSDGNGCTQSENIAVSEPLPITLNVQATQTLCVGSSDGTAEVLANGGTGAYTYSWNTNPVQTTSTATGLSAGNYSITVTDANGCTESGNTSVGSPTALSASVTTTDVSCNAGNDGTATVSVSGGTQGYAYAWNTTPAQTTATATGLTAGAWTVTITDANGCTETETGALSEPSLLTVQVAGTDVSCAGAGDGTATASVNGGTGPYLYSWTSTPTQSTATATGLPGGNFTVEVTDANGCIATQTVSLNEPQPLAITLTGVDPTCNGGNNGSIAAQVTGGDGSYNYTWNTTPVQTTSIATGIGAGNYSVTVTDGNGCQATENLALSQVSPISVLATVSDVNCHGGSDGEVTVFPSGGTGPYSYQWNTTPAQQGATATGLAPGTYTVTVTDANNCTKTQDVSVAEPTPIVVNTSHTNVNCHGGNDGSGLVVVTGGTMPYSYAWNTSPVQTTATATQLGRGTYGVTITDANGCTANSSVDIIEPTPLEVVVTGPEFVCVGSSAQLNTTVSGGTGPYGYNWASNPTGAVGSSSSLTATLDQTTTFEVTVTDANGCTQTRDYKIRVRPLPVAAFEAGPLEGCDSLEVFFQNNSTRAVSFYWLFGDGTTSTLENPSHVYGNGEFDVTLIVTSADGCVDSLTQPGLVTVLPTPIAAFITLEDLSQGITVSNANIHFINQSQFANTYFWEFGDGGVSGATDPIHTFTDPGSYDVTLYAYNTFGCVDSTQLGGIEIIPDGQIFTPNAFSPNGDGVNETFQLKGEGVTEYLLIIFDRWGREIFRSVDMNHSWDGTFQGEAVQEGVFVWKLEAGFNSQARVQRGGTVTLIR